MAPDASSFEVQTPQAEAVGSLRLRIVSRMALFEGRKVYVTSVGVVVVVEVVVVGHVDVLVLVYV